MTLQEAIKICSKAHSGVGIRHGHDFFEALKLGIEASNLVESLRVGVPRHLIRLLPSETKE